MTPRVTEGGRQSIMQGKSCMIEVRALSNCNVRLQKWNGLITVRRYICGESIFLSPLWMWNLISEQGGVRKEQKALILANSFTEFSLKQWDTCRLVQ